MILKTVTELSDKLNAADIQLDAYKKQNEENSSQLELYKSKIEVYESTQDLVVATKEYIFYLFPRPAESEDAVEKLTSAFHKYTSVVADLVERKNGILSYLDGINLING